jgi:transcriptional regulator with XRE-family HTH domain
MPDMMVDVKALYAALDAKRQSLGMSWRTLAQSLDIAPSTFTRIAQGRRPDVDTFATLVRWVGVSAETFIQSAATMRDADVESAAMISAFLRADRHLTPEAATALEELIEVAYRTLRRDTIDADGVR